MATKVPRSKENDYTREMAEARRRFVKERTGAALEHVGSYSFDPARAAGQHRELHGRRAGADRPGGPAADRRRARAGRVLHPDGDHRGHAGRELQPRHAAAERERRRQDDGRRAVHAALAGVHPRRRAARRATFGDWVDEHFDEIKAVAETTTRVGQADQHRPVLDRPAALPALQLHDRRRRRPEHDRQGDFAACEWIKSQLPGRRQLHPVGQHGHRQEALAHQHAADRAASASSPSARIQRRPAEEPDGRRRRRSCSGRARSRTPARSWPARRTTARTPPTA